MPPAFSIFSFADLLKRFAVDDIAIREDLVEARHVDNCELDPVAVREAWEFGEAHRQRRLSTLEPGTLGATRARALALVATAGSAAVTATVAASDALSGLTRTRCWEQVVDLHVCGAPFHSLDGAQPSALPLPAARRRLTSSSRILADTQGSTRGRAQDVVD